MMAVGQVDKMLLPVAQDPEVAEEEKTSRANNWNHYKLHSSEHTGQSQECHMHFVIFLTCCNLSRAFAQILGKQELEDVPKYEKTIMN